MKIEFSYSKLYRCPILEYVLRKEDSILISSIIDELADEYTFLRRRSSFLKAHEDSLEQYFVHQEDTFLISRALTLNQITYKLREFNLKYIDDMNAYFEN